MAPACETCRYEEAVAQPGRPEGFGTCSRRGWCSVMQQSLRARVGAPSGVAGEARRRVAITLHGSPAGGWRGLSSLGESAAAAARDEPMDTWHAPCSTRLAGAMSFVVRVHREDGVLIAQASGSASLADLCGMASMIGVTTSRSNERRAVLDVQAVDIVLAFTEHLHLGTFVA